MNELCQFQVDSRSSRYSKPSVVPFIVITPLQYILHHSSIVKPTKLPFSPFSSTTHQILISQTTLIKITPIQSPPHPQSTLLTKTTLHHHRNNNPIISNSTTKQKDSTINTHQLQPNTPLPLSPCHPTPSTHFTHPPTHNRVCTNRFLPKSMSCVNTSSSSSSANGNEGG